MGATPDDTAAHTLNIADVNEAPNTLPPPPPDPDPDPSPETEPPVDEDPGLDETESEGETEDQEQVAPRPRESSSETRHTEQIGVGAIRLNKELESTQLTLVTLTVGNPDFSQLKSASNSSDSTSGDTSDGTSALGAFVDMKALRAPIQQVWQEMDNITENMKKDMYFRKVVLSTVVGSSTLASAGFAIWTLRAGYLTAMLLSATPTWATLDVIPLLDFETAEKRKANVDPVVAAADATLDNKTDG